MITEPLKVGVIGGSISGCAVAAALSRSGMDVRVFERSSKGLRDRGSGIAISGPLRADLMERGYLPQDFPTCEMQQRWWQYADGSQAGRNLWTQPTPAFANNWGNLWRALRDLVPDDRYVEGKALQDFVETQSGVSASFADGTVEQFDLLIGADGYKSIVRDRLHPNSTPEYAGYILWRGNYPEAEVKDTSLILAMDRDKAWITVPFPGGHGVLYMIPGFDGQVGPGQRRVNWAIYANCPPAQPLTGIESVPPGGVTDGAFKDLQTLLTTHFPPEVRPLFAHTGQNAVSIQPIYDSVVETYVGKHVLLIGDAGTMTRPHTASGATKALEDALALEKLAAETDTLPELLHRYDALRCGQAKTVSEIGRRIGRAQVTDTPDWAEMTPKDFEDWIAATLAGDTLYLYGEKA